MLTKSSPSLSNSCPPCKFTSLIQGFLILFLLSGTIVAQPFTFVAGFDDILGFVGADQLGSKYSIESGGLKKIAQTSKVYFYSNRQFGPVSSVDITDPLNILVFFADFGVIVLLDNNLAEKKIITPRQLHDHDLPTRICFSAKQGFWGYFPDAGKLTRFSFRPSIEVASENLSQLFGKVLRPHQLVESNDKLFLVDNGIWVFDLFANYLFHVDHIQQSYVQVRGDKIFYQKEDTLYVYDFFLKQETLILLPEKGVKSFHVKNHQSIYLQTDQSLKLYLFAGELF